MCAQRCSPRTFGVRRLGRPALQRPEALNHSFTLTCQNVKPGGGSTGRKPSITRTRTTDCLLLNTAHNIGGMERVVCSLARELANAGWMVRTVFPHASTRTSSRLLNWTERQGINAEVSSALVEAHMPHTFARMLALRRLVQDARPRVVNLHYGSNFISLKDVLAVRAAGTSRCLVTLHSVESWDALGVQKKRMTRAAARLCHGVVAISDATRQMLLDAGVPDSKVHVIPNGVAIPNTLLTRREARLRLGLPEGAFIVASLARLVPGKGLADLIIAATQVPDPDRELFVVIGGDGPERGALEQLAHTRLNGRAIFLGELVGNTDELHAAADVFALPSYREGFPVVYLEAALYGRPSIGTNVGGSKEVIADGETGLLIPPGDPEALAAAIRRLRDDAALRQRLGEAAYVRVRSEFTLRKMVCRYKAVFEGRSEPRARI